jgi:hypothetical protein
VEPSEGYNTFAEVGNEENQHGDSAVPVSGIDTEATPSPADSASEGMTSVLPGRKRTTLTLNNTTGVGRNLTAPPSSSTWSTIASTWGALRRKPTLPSSQNSNASGTAAISEDEDELGARARAARELLKRFDVGSGTLANGKNN